MLVSFGNGGGGALLDAGAWEGDGEGDGADGFGSASDCVDGLMGCMSLPASRASWTLRWYLQVASDMWFLFLMSSKLCGR